MSSRLSRHKRIRKKIYGTSSRPRVSVYRSNKNLQAQLIDDDRRITLMGMSTKSLKKNGTKTDVAKYFGIEFGKAVMNLENGRYRYVVFDRGGYKFHGRVKAFADGLRESGLIF